MPTFAELPDLADRELRAILHSAEAPERLRAAWVLALRRGGTAVETIRDVARSEVPEGLRQQLVVVLSGLGERAVVMDIASNDVAPAVRAVAVAYALRTAEVPHGDELFSFVRAKLHDESSEVRVAVLEEAQYGRIALDTGQLKSATTDNEEAVRRAAWCCLIACAPRDPAAAAVVARVAGKVQVRDLHEVVGTLNRVDTLNFLSALKDHNKFAIANYLTSVIPKGLELSWEELAFLFDCREPIVRSAVLERARGEAPLSALPWLVEGILDSSDERYLWGAREWQHIAKLLAPASVDLVAPGERSRLALFIERRRALALADLQSPEEEDEWDGIDRTFLENEFVNLSRLLSYIQAAD